MKTSTRNKRHTPGHVHFCQRCQNLGIDQECLEKSAEFTLTDFKFGTDVTHCSRFKAVELRESASRAAQ